MNEDGDVNECLIRNGMLKGPVDHYTAYALINVFVALGKDTNLNAKLRVGSDDAVRVWLNGDIKHTHAERRSSYGYQDEIPVTLKGGFNLLMVKVSDHDSGWGLFVGLDIPFDKHKLIDIELPYTPVDIWDRQKELPLMIFPDPPISQIAFGKESTYFVFTLKYPQFTEEDRPAVIYEKCVIALDMEGVPGLIEGYEVDEEEEVEISSEPVYFMFQLEEDSGFPEDKGFADALGDIAKTGVIIFSGATAAQAVKKLGKKAVKQVGKKAASETVDKAIRIVDDGIEIVSIIVDGLVSEGVGLLLDHLFPKKACPGCFCRGPYLSPP